MLGRREQRWLEETDVARFLLFLFTFTTSSLQTSVTLISLSSINGQQCYYIHYNNITLTDFEGTRSVSLHRGVHYKHNMSSVKATTTEASRGYRDRKEESSQSWSSNLPACLIRGLDRNPGGSHLVIFLQQGRSPYPCVSRNSERSHFIMVSQ